MDSFVYGYEPTMHNGTLIATIKKNNINYVHISIHVSPSKLEPNKQGIIHFKKDIYLKKVNKRTSHKIYTLIHIEQPPNKLNSLRFFRTDGDVTNVDKSQGDYDADLAIEMDIILAVMNRIFDEDDKEYYIGDSDSIYPIHNKTNNLLNNVNRLNVIPKRRNIGSMLMPSLQHTNHIIGLPLRKRTAKVKKNTRNQSANKESSRKSLKIKKEKKKK